MKNLRNITFPSAAPDILKIHTLFTGYKLSADKKKMREAFWYIRVLSFQVSDFMFILFMIRGCWLRVLLKVLVLSLSETD